jgi:hypothetical protein
MSKKGEVDTSNVLLPTSSGTWATEAIIEKSYSPAEGAEMWGWEKDRYRRKPTAALLSRQIAKLKPIPGVGGVAVTIRGTFPLNTEKRRKETSIRTKWEDAKKLEAELLESGELIPGGPKKAKGKGKGKKKKEKVVRAIIFHCTRLRMQTATETKSINHYKTKTPTQSNHSNSRT